MERNPDTLWGNAKMGRFDAITKYNPLIKAMKADEYYVMTGDVNNNAFRPSPVIDELIMAIIDFSNCMKESEDDHLWYRSVLEENGIDPKPSSLQEVDMSDLDAKCVIGMMNEAISQERFGEGMLLNYFTKGCFQRWLDRLEEINLSDEP